MTQRIKYMTQLTSDQRAAIGRFEEAVQRVEQLEASHTQAQVEVNEWRTRMIEALCNPAEPEA